MIGRLEKVLPNPQWRGDVMSKRVLISSGSRFEKVFGYSRAVQVGPWVFVAGCTAAGPDGPVGGPDIAEQTRECLRRVGSALNEAGAGLTDVVRTRLFVTDIAAWEAVGQVHREVFADILPASTIVEVSALVYPDLLVEVEADALIG
jgi:enamine deaminase RidA (YjgF/YER057c/UK114 family)